MMARTNGKTLGRMAMGIRVVRANGEPMTFGWAMLREVVVKALLFGVRRLAHVRAGEPRSTCSGRCGTTRTARCTTSSSTRASCATERQASAARWAGAVWRPASVQMICSRPGPTPISAIGTPTKSAM